MKTLTLLVLLLGLGGCDPSLKIPECKNPPHEYSKWETSSKQYNGFGTAYTVQARHCEKCGYEMIERHK